MDIQTTVSACNAVMAFDDPWTAIVFLKMVAHIIPPEQYISWIKAVLPGDEDAAYAAAKIVNQCMGMGS